MLNGLDEIDWADLSHAYGSAADVPGLLPAVATATGDPWGDGKPMYELYGNIWHQHTVYQATAPAVPFLVELAAAPATPNRAAILMLLADIAQGIGVEEDLYDAPLTDERCATAAARGAVSVTAPVLMSLTHDADADVRLGAAHVLAHLPAHAIETNRRLAEMAVAESPGLHRAGVLLLMGWTAVPGNGGALRAALAGSDPIERAAAAVSLVRRKPDRPPRAAADLVAGVLQSGELEDLFRGLPWDVGEGMADLEDWAEGGGG